MGEGNGVISVLNYFLFSKKLFPLMGEGGELVWGGGDTISHATALTQQVFFLNCL